MPKTKHTCAIRGCTTGRGEGQIMCRSHWDQVPKALQHRVYSEYHRKQGSAAHLRAIRDAVQHVNDLLDEKLLTIEKRFSSEFLDHQPTRKIAMSTDVLDPPETGGSISTGSDIVLHHPDQSAADPAESPDELRRLHYDEIISLGRRVDEAKSEWTSLKNEQAEAKKEYEGLLNSYLRLTRRDPMQRGLPLGEPATGEPAAVDDSWRRLDINQLDITPGAMDKLYQHGIMTLGDLSDFWKDGKQLCDVKGIGEASDTAIRDAFSTYGVEHPEVFGGAAEGDGDEAGEDADEGDGDDGDGGIDGT